MLRVAVLLALARLCIAQEAEAAPKRGDEDEVETWKDKKWMFPKEVAMAGTGNFVAFPPTPHVGLEDCCSRKLTDIWIGEEMAESAEGSQVKAMVLGNEKGQCCFLLNVGPGVIEANHTPQTVMTDIGIKFGDFGKTVSSFITIALVEEGMIKLDSKVKDLLPWWTDKSVEDVTVMDLLTLTAGMKNLEEGETTCSGLEGFDFTRKCAQLSYETGVNNSWKDKFAYSKAGNCDNCMNAVENGYYVLAAIALEATGYRFYNDLFIRHIAQPLGLNTSTCRMSFAYGRDPDFSLKNPTPGLGLNCTMHDAVKLWHHTHNKKIVKEAHHDLMETPYLVGTPNAIKMDDAKAWFKVDSKIAGWSLDWGLGMWLMCEGDECDKDKEKREESGVLLTAGNARLMKTWEAGGGTFMSDFNQLWVFRHSGGQGHWGMFLDTGVDGAKHTDTAARTLKVWDLAWPLIRQQIKYQHFYVWSKSTTTLTPTTTTTTWLRLGERCLFFEEETKECLVRDGEEFWTGAFRPSLSLTMALCTLVVVMMGVRT